MNRFTLTVLTFIAVLIENQAQEFKILGKIIDSVEGNPLESATIYAEVPKDSSLVNYAISNKDGNFELQGKTGYKQLNVYFTFNGYKTRVLAVEIQSQVDLGLIKLEEQSQELNEVQVVGERIPIQIKKDTLEFNAGAFKIRPDATVEEVLRKLPGVEIDSEGKITVNGKEVDQVLVNGQVFFSKDPKIATKSLPADVIDKIQILNSKTKEEEFTGDIGDGNTKTINLTLKEDKTNGFMGRLTGGYGQDKRYQANGLFNYFNKSKRVSFLMSSNNINNAGFSFDEVFEMVGNSRSGGIMVNSNGAFSIGNLAFGFGQGIVTSSTIGASFADKKEKEYEVGGNYFFSYGDSFNNEKTSRENFLPNNHYFTDIRSSFTGNTNSNQGSANLEFDIDKTLRISLAPTLNVGRSNAIDVSNTANTNEENALINTNTTQQVTDGFERKFSNELEIMKKLDTLGRYFRVAFSNNNVAGISRSNLWSTSELFGNDPGSNTLDQETNIDNLNDQFQIATKYRQPFGKGVFLDLGYSYENRNQRNERSVFELDNATGQYTVFSESLSSDFEFVNAQHTPTAELRLEKEKLQVEIGAAYNLIGLNNRDFLQNVSFSQDYDKLLFNANLNYTLGQNTGLSLSYQSFLDIPAINQIQPVPNVTNPLNIVIGQPNLSPTTNHSLFFDFSNYNWQERLGFFVYAGLNFSNDQVVNVSNTNENLVRVTTFANVSGAYNHYVGISYSKQIKKDSVYTLKFNLRPYLNLQNNIGFTNGSQLVANQFNASPRMGLTFNYKEKLEIEPEYTFGYNSTKYNLGTLQDLNYITQRFALKTTTYWPQNLVWANDISFMYNGNVGPGFDKDALFWNMSLGLQIMEKKGTIKLLGYDLLNQNINTRRTAGQDFIQDYQGTVLRRYFMASFTLKFDSFGGSGAPNKSGNRIMMF